MGRPGIRAPHYGFVYGGAPEALCGECQLPCRLDEIGVDCLRRFFLQGLLQCTYFVEGYCFYSDGTGCVLDNGGEHERYWMTLLNQYHHHVVGTHETTDPRFQKHVEEFRCLIEDQIAARRVSLCRYLEEYYNRVMETGGGVSEDMLEKLDTAYMALLGGTSRKK